MGDEVTLVGRNGLDRGHPFATARKRGDGLGAVAFVQGVEDDGQTVPRPFNNLRAVHVFTVVEDRAELEQRVGPPRCRRIRHPCREHSVAHPFGDGGALRAVGADQQLDVTGRSATNPSVCSMRMGAPSHCTVSPRNSARSATTYSSTTAHFSGRLPRV